MDTQSTKNYKTPSYMRKANINYYYRCKEDPEKQVHIKERQQKNSKSYYERNKEKIRERQRMIYAKKKEAEKMKKEAEQKLNEQKENIKLSTNLNDRRLVP